MPGDWFGEVVETTWRETIRTEWAETKHRNRARWKL